MITFKPEGMKKMSNKNKTGEKRHNSISGFEPSLADQSHRRRCSFIIIDVEKSFSLISIAVLVSESRDIPHLHENLSDGL